MSKVYNEFCETRDDVLIAMDAIGLNASWMKLLKDEQGKDCIRYLLIKQMERKPLFLDEAIEDILEWGGEDVAWS